MGWKTCTFSLSFKPRGLPFAPMNISSSIQVRHQRHSGVRAGARHLLLLSCCTSSRATSHSPGVPKLLLLPFLHLCLHSLADVGPDVLATQDRIDGLVFVVELGDGTFEVGNKTLVFAWLCDERPRPSSGQGIHRVRREGLGWQFTSFKFGDALNQCPVLLRRLMTLTIFVRTWTYACSVRILALRSPDARSSISASLFL